MKVLKNLKFPIYPDSSIDGSPKLNAKLFKLRRHFSNQKLHTKNKDSIEILFFVIFAYLHQNLLVHVIP